MKIKPYITEKTVAMAQKNRFTVQVKGGLKKSEIIGLVKRVFNLNPLAVRTINIASRKKQTAKKRQVVERGISKAIITLKEGETFPGFETFLKELAQAADGRNGSKIQKKNQKTPKANK